MPEKQIIEKIRRWGGKASRAVVKGIGDDCAVLRVPAGHEVLVTTDFSLEGVHFRREWFAAHSVGHRCVTRGLSDIAAMGGEPLAVFLSLALPADVAQAWVDEFMRGFMALARRFGVPLAGGDTAQSPGGNAGRSTRGRKSRPLARDGKVLADVIVLGSVPRGKAVLRSGAKVGDDIYVTGTVGAAAAGLKQLSAPQKMQVPPLARENRARSVGMTTERKLFYPTPRLAVGCWLRERGLAAAMIDISDGLSTDLEHICTESKVGAWIAQAAVPVAPGATLDDALHGGDEYELLFTAPAAKHDRIPDRIAGVPITWIGTVTRAGGMWLVDAEMKRREKLEAKGWEHFR